MVATHVEFEKELSVLKEENPLIIVEGKKDKNALHRLGLTNVVTLSKKPIFQVAEECAAVTSTVIVLTDLDSEGKRLYSKLSEYLSRLGVTVDNRFRNFLFRSTELRQIEGLTNYVKRLYNASFSG